MKAQLLCMRQALPRQYSFFAGSPVKLSPRQVCVTTSRRRVAVINAVDVDSAISSAQGLRVAATAGFGLVAAFAIGAASAFSSKGGRVTSISPSRLPEYLNQSDTVLVDIRSKAVVKESGIPDIKGFKARFISFPYTSMDRDGNEVVVSNYGEAFAKMRGLKEQSVVILMDEDGKMVSQAGKKILEFVEFKTIYYVSNGTFGKNGMKDVGFKWKEPPKAMSWPKIEVSGLDLDKIAEAYKEQPTLFNTGLALGALTTAAVVLFNEFDLIFETVGILGGANLLLRNFFFAKDRTKTINDISDFVNEKVAARDAGDDLKKLASTILEVSPDPNTSSPSAEDEKDKGKMAPSETNAVPVTDA